MLPVSRGAASACSGVDGQLQQQQQVAQHTDCLLRTAGSATQGQVHRRMRRLSGCHPLRWGACLLSAQRDGAGCTRMHLVSAWHMAIIFGHRRKLPSKRPRAAPHSLYHCFWKDTGIHCVTETC